MKHYISFGGRFYAHYMYFDINTDEHYIADSLFYKRNIPVIFKGEMVRDGDKYIAVFCKIKRRYKDSFEKALEELKTKMELLGHLDYEKYCQNTIKQIGEKHGISDKLL